MKKSRKPHKAPLLQLDAKGEPTFIYTRAAETDLRATFARIREQQQASSIPANVKSITAAKRAKP